MSNPQAYYFLPPELFTSEYRNYSNEAKLLFSMVLTNMTTATAVMETAKLIDDIGVRKISAMHKIIEADIQKSRERSF